MQELIIYALLGAFFNSFLRGGFIKTWWPNFRGGKIINAVAFGIAAYFAVNNYLYASLLGLGMLIGQAPAIFHPLSDYAKKTGHVFMWVLVVMERGIVWSLPLIAASGYWAHYEALWWLVLAVAMPVCYSLDWTRWKYRWVMAEVIYGACMWSLLLLM
jgi:hypothetical protein